MAAKQVSGCPRGCGLLTFPLHRVCIAPNYPALRTGRPVGVAMERASWLTLSFVSDPRTSQVNGAWHVAGRFATLPRSVRSD